MQVMCQCGHWEEVWTLREENARVREENSRVREENSRMREENARLREDNIRMREEDARLYDENARLREENIRLREEHVRVREESVRVREESARLRADSAHSPRSTSPPALVPASASASMTSDSLATIPALLESGNFNPKRLAGWNFAEVARCMERDSVFHQQLLDALFRLFLSNRETIASTEAPCCLEEKKAVSFLFAARHETGIFTTAFDECCRRMEHGAAPQYVRILLIMREYLAGELSLPWAGLEAALAPIAALEILNRRFVDEHPLAALILTHPSIHPAKAALERLLQRTTPVLVPERDECVFVLTMAARLVSPARLHQELLVPLWTVAPTRSTAMHVAGIVLKTLVECNELRSFCQHKLQLLYREADENTVAAIHAFQPIK